MVVLCNRDPLTGVSHQHDRVHAAENTVLNVYGVFAFRPAYNDYRDYGVFLDIAPEGAGSNRRPSDFQDGESPPEGS